MDIWVASMSWLCVSKFLINIIEFTIVKDTETLVQKKKRGKNEGNKEKK